MSMTVEQALKVVAIALSSDRTSDEDRLAFGVLRSHIEREVDEAMVERAIAAWFDTGFKYEGEHKPRMKAALIAALEGK